MQTDIEPLMEAIARSIEELAKKTDTPLRFVRDFQYDHDDDFEDDWDERSGSFKPGPPPDWSPKPCPVCGTMCAPARVEVTGSWDTFPSYIPGFRECPNDHDKAHFDYYTEKAKADRAQKASDPARPSHDSDGQL